MKRARAEDELDGLNMVKCLMLLSRVGVGNPASSSQAAGGFKCKTCNRVFPSFQALGGHRASHRRPKLMLSSPSHHLPLKLNKTHPCPICGLQFGIGQALGGHMRKHRAPVHNKHKFDLSLDLNLTPLENDHLNLNLTTPLVHFFD